jgi:hypothetical protein
MALLSVLAILLLVDDLRSLRLLLVDTIAP